MVNTPNESRGEIPFRDEMEQRFAAKVVTYDDLGVDKPGGMCNCCGAGPNPTPGFQAEPWYIYKAGICDSDGVYYAMLCESCLEEIRVQNTGRTETIRDQMAELVNDMMGEDIDGAQSMMDDMRDPEFE